MCCRLWCNAPTMLPAASLEAEFLRFQATGRQNRGYIIQQTAKRSLVHLKVGPKHVEPIGMINKPLLLHLVGCLYYLYQ